MNSDYVPVTRIKVFGVGGGGCNAVNRMVEANMIGVDFYAVNTDQQVLTSSSVENKLLLGFNTTHGLGAGGIPEVGKAAALETIEDIKAAVQDADMIFVTTGLGGGTGTGAAPIVAQCAKEAGALTIAVVTKPFNFEGKRRMMQALNGLDELKKYVDSVIIIPNEKVNAMLGSVPIKQAFQEADNVLRQAVQTITDLVSYKAYINLDFADIRATLSGQGTALIGVGQVSPDEVGNKNDLGKEAAARAINCPLLEGGIQGAKNAIVNISGADSLTISLAEEAIKQIRETAGEDMDIIFGMATNDSLKDSIIVTVIATGFESENGNNFTQSTYDNNKQTTSEKVDDNIDMPDFFSRRMN